MRPSEGECVLRGEFIKPLFIYKEAVWTAEEMISLQLEISGLSTVVERTSAQHCSSGLRTLKFHLLVHAVEYLERLGSSSLTNAGPCRHFNVLIKQYLKMTSGRDLTVMYEMVHSKSGALQSMRTENSRVRGGVFGAFLLKNRECVGSGGWCFARDRVCVSLERLAEAVERAGTGLPLQQSFGEVLA